MQELNTAHLDAWTAKPETGTFAPQHDLEQMTTPTLWLLGELDLSVPPAASALVLAQASAKRPEFDHQVLARANHGLARVDPAGVWYIPNVAWETQFEFLGNLGLLERNLSFSFKTRLKH